MHKIIKSSLICLMLVGAVFSQTRNYNGWLDTASIVDSIGVDDYYYTPAFELSKNLNLRVDVKGYRSATYEFLFGYQTGHLTIDSTGLALAEFGTNKANLDTVWSPRVKIEQWDMDSVGMFSDDSMDVDGKLAKSPGKIDTLSVDGFAVMSVNYAPEWDKFVRYYLKGVAGSSTDTVSVFFQHNVRIAHPVKEK